MCVVSQCITWAYARACTAMTHTVAVQIDVALAAGDNARLAALCEARHMQVTNGDAAKDELRRLYDLLRARGLALVRIPGHGPVGCARHTAACALVWVAPTRRSMCGSVCE